jgi:hypothetical protein
MARPVAIFLASAHDTEASRDLLTHNIGGVLKFAQVDPHTAVLYGKHRKVIFALQLA